MSFNKKFICNNHLNFSVLTEFMYAKLKNALYGLKKATRPWYEKLHHVLIQFRLSSCKCDHSLFLYNHQGITLYIFVYVDDILLTRTSSKLIHDFIIKHNEKNSLKKLVTPKYFLGIEVKYQFNGSLFLTQLNYIKIPYPKLT